MWLQVYTHTHTHIDSLGPQAPQRPRRGAWKLTGLLYNITEIITCLLYVQ